MVNSHLQLNYILELPMADCSRAVYTLKSEVDFSALILQKNQLLISMNKFPVVHLTILLTLKVPVTAIDALRHFETG